MKNKNIKLEKTVELSMKHVMQFLSGRPEEAGFVRIVKKEHCSAKHEIAVIIFCIGDRERSIILSTSYETAVKIVGLFRNEKNVKANYAKIKSLMKDCLGECVNILANRIASDWQDQKPLRVTTPSIIFGQELSIDPEPDKACRIYIMTSAGTLELSITEYKE